MSSPLIAALRSVSLNVPDLARATAFYTGTWHLDVVSSTEHAVYLRGTGPDHHLLALHAADGAPAIRNVTLRARSLEALTSVAHATARAGGRVVLGPAPLEEVSGGIGITIRDPDGRLIQIVHGDITHANATGVKDRPLRLAHVVLNSHAVEQTQRFFETALGFRLSDRTRIMAFLNCNRDHHSIALGDTDNDALNHIAFLMPDVDSVMRGAGRMKDAGYPIEWGPGRHGPGDNAFNYFVGPFGEVIEYTAEVLQIDETYRSKGASEWNWPAGRVDQWGISAPPSARLKLAQRAVFFTPSD
jgi:catechol-2,3-dioxygenase